MKNEVIHINTEEIESLATEYFINICGFKKDAPKYRKLLNMGMEIKEEMKYNIDIRAIVSSFPKELIKGNTVHINGITFICNAFEQIDPDNIIQTYAYILSAGNCELNPEDPIMKQLYTDIWGTAFVDAGLEALKMKLGNNNFIESFGPGFYGMEVTQVGNFFQLLEGEKIGVEVRNNSFMVPQKSCTGFLVALTDESKLPAADCKSCKADHKGCTFCQAVFKNDVGGGSYGSHRL